MRTSLIGRSKVIDRARALTDEGAGVLFVGEPGVGKTRLLAEVLDLLATRNWYVEKFVPRPWLKTFRLVPDLAAARRGHRPHPAGGWRASEAHRTG